MPLAILRTNMTKADLPSNILETFTNYLVENLNYDKSLVMFELRTDIPMMRGGSMAPMINVEFHHNDDKIKEDTKREKAGVLARFLTETTNVKIDRILVLFFDTRCTTVQSSEL